MANAPSMGIERIRVNVGAKFRPDKPAHVDKVLAKIAAEHGEGFELDGYEPSEGVAIFRRESNTLVASHSGNDSMEIRLPQDTKQSDGKKRAVSLADTYPGYQMTTFEPHRRRAIISKLSDEVIRARDAISNALSVDPWNIQVAQRTDGGFDFSLPWTYRPSKHDDGLWEATTVIIGQPGWYVEADTHTRTGSIIPAELSTFEAAYKTPLPKKMERFDHTDKSHFKVPMGVTLPDPGKRHQTMYLDLDAHNHSQVGGTSGSGKTVSINAYIAYLLARQVDMVIIDTRPSLWTSCGAKSSSPPGGGGATRSGTLRPPPRWSAKRGSAAAKSSSATARSTGKTCPLTRGSSRWWS